MKVFVLCKICNKEFKNKKSLSNHLRYGCGGRKVIKECMTCGIEFKARSCISEKVKYCSRKCTAIALSVRYKGRKGRNMQGSNNPNWIDGRTPLRIRIRNLPECKEWANRVFKKDDYTCQICSKRGGSLEAHHDKRKFHNILTDFLQEYNQFSPIEDKETLVRLAITYEPFWEVDIGQTLCGKCHYKADKEDKIAYLCA